MQKKSSSKGTIITLIVITIIALLAYFYYKGTPTDSSDSLNSLSVTQETGEAQQANNRILSLLNQISELEIDDSIFDNIVYQSLIDYTVDIPEQNVGRVNPFAPISR